MILEIKNAPVRYTWKCYRYGCFNYPVRFMAMEARKGNGPFYLDCSRMTPEDKKQMEPDGGWMALQYKKMLRDGLRPLEDRQEWTAGIQNRNYPERPGSKHGSERRAGADEIEGDALYNTTGGAVSAGVYP